MRTKYVLVNFLLYITRRKVDEKTLLRDFLPSKCKYKSEILCKKKDHVDKRILGIKFDCLENKTVEQDIRSSRGKLDKSFMEIANEMELVLPVNFRLLLLLMPRINAYRRSGGAFEIAVAATIFVRQMLDNLYLQRQVDQKSPVEEEKKGGEEEEGEEEKFKNCTSISDLFGVGDTNRKYYGKKTINAKVRFSEITVLKEWCSPEHNCTLQSSKLYINADGAPFADVFFLTEEDSVVAIQAKDTSKRLSESKVYLEYVKGTGEVKSKDERKVYRNCIFVMSSVSDEMYMKGVEKEQKKVEHVGEGKEKKKKNKKKGKKKEEEEEEEEGGEKKKKKEKKGKKKEEEKGGEKKSVTVLNIVKNVMHHWKAKNNGL